MPRSSRLSSVFAVALAIASLAPSTASAQAAGLDPQCAALTGLLDRPLQDACQKAVDIFGLVAPQLGPGVAGGNALLGGGSALGRFGRVSIGARANVVRGRLPRLAATTVSTGGAQATDYATTEPAVFIPTAEGALGVFRGFDVGTARVGALDLIASLTYVPNYDNPDVTVEGADGRFGFGYGARVGLLQETAVIPGIGLTYLRRDLPESNLLGLIAASQGIRNDTLGVVGLRTETQAWRLVGSKTFSVVSFSGGAGQDFYRSRGRVRAVLNETLPIVGAIRLEANAFDLRQRVTRTNYFADVSLTLPVVVVTGEIGRASGGETAPSFNTFDGRTDRAGDAITYYALGLRLRF
jgi:hypothetical protein